MCKGGYTGSVVTFRRRNKYFNKTTVVDGITFDSKSEAQRYGELLLLFNSRLIINLGLQPKFPLHSITGEEICKYIADFYYETQDGKRIVEDRKGFKTDVYRLKKKWFQSEYPNLIFYESVA